MVLLDLPVGSLGLTVVVVGAWGIAIWRSIGGCRRAEIEIEKETRSAQLDDR